MVKLIAEENINTMKAITDKLPILVLDSENLKVLYQEVRDDSYEGLYIEQHIIIQDQDIQLMMKEEVFDKMLTKLIEWRKLNVN